MNLSPVEAINRVNESVTVEMLVQRTKCCTGSRQVFLDSEANYRDPKNLGVVVTEVGRAKFGEAGIDDPTIHFKGKTIRVRGVVIRKENRPYIEVSDPSQIEMANARCLGSRNILLISARIDGDRVAPAMPSSPRATISIGALVENAARVEAIPKPAAPRSSNLRRPMRSPRVPMVIMKPASMKP